MPYLSLIKYGSTFAAGLLAMWLYHSAVVSGMNEAVALERQKAAEQLQTVAAKAQKEVAKIDQYWYEKMQRELAAVPEPGRVFIRAKCPAVSATGNPSVDDGARAELGADHRQLVRELRQRALRLENKLAAWQALAKKSPQ